MFGKSAVIFMSSKSAIFEFQFKIWFSHNRVSHYSLFVCTSAYNVLDKSEALWEGDEVWKSFIYV